MNYTSLIVFGAIITLVIIGGYKLLAANSGELPNISEKELGEFQAVSKFVDSFIKADFQAKQLLNRSNKTLFSQGYRPKIGLINDPEKNADKFNDLLKYFKKKFYLDINSVKPFSKKSFENLIDKLSNFSGETLDCSGRLGIKYDLNLQGRFIFDKELKKIPEGDERNKFKSCWLNDFILSTEVRLMAWIFQGLYGEEYLNPFRK